MTDDLFLIRYEKMGDTVGRRAGHVGLQIGDKAYSLDSTLVPSLTMPLLASCSASELIEKVQTAKRDEIDLEDSEIVPLAPIDDQEVWAAGVTYKRSEEAREAESHNSTMYTRVYSAQRPELFFKAMGRDVVGDEGRVGIRYDATWSVPEPELVVVINSQREVVGFTIGNDMSSRDIEGENPLYLPQAKVYQQSCALGPRIWLQPGSAEWPEVAIKLTINRAGKAGFEGETSTKQLHRTMADLVEYLGRCKRFSAGAYLFSGTGIVPPDTFTLMADDEVRIRIDPIGELVNTVKVVGGKD